MSERSHVSSARMAKNSWSCALAFAALLASCAASGEFSVVRSPDSLKFTGREPLPESLVKEVYSAALGFSAEHGPGWSGLLVDDPFGCPEAVVEVFVDGVASLGAKAHLKGRKYPLLTDYSEFGTKEALRRRIAQRFPEGGNRLVDVNLSEGPEAIDEYGDIFGKIDEYSGKASYKALKPKTDDEDYQFVQDLELLKSVADKILAGAVVPDNKVDYFFFTFPSLHALSDLHGENSAAAAEAKALLGEAVSKLADAFYRAYDGNVLVTLVTSDSSHTRRARSVLDESSASNIHLLNIAKTYSADYPVVFNIIFWFSVVMILALIAISYVIGDMDPGRDSIIYRMTSNRMKKEN